MEPKAKTKQHVGLSSDKEPSTTVGRTKNNREGYLEEVLT